MQNTKERLKLYNKKASYSIKKKATDLNRHIIKEETQTTKDHLSLKKCKPKQQEVTEQLTIQLAKICILTIPIAEENVEKQELSFLVGGMQNGTATL